MGTIAMQINNMVAQLDEPEQVLVLEIIKRFLPDNVATTDDLSIIATAREEYRTGKTVNENDINWD